MEKKLVKSVPFKDYYLLCNILDPYVIAITEAEYKAYIAGDIEKISAKTIAKLEKANCLHTDRSTLLASAKKKTIDRLSFPSLIYISTTLGCNSKCDFCVVPTRSESIRRVKLSKQSIDAAMLQFSDYYLDKYPESTEQVTVLFYGGEPLENFQAILDTMSCIESLPLSFRERLSFHLCTNGYNLTDDIFSYLKNKKINISVAWEPIQSIHKLYRDYYGKVRNNIEKSLAFGIETSLSVAMVPEVLPYISVCIDEIEKLGITSYGFNFIRGSYLSKKKVSIDDYSQLLVRQLANNFERLIGKEYQTTKRYRMLENKEPLSIDCGCYGNQFVLFPDGSIGNCPFQTTGSVKLSNSPTADELNNAKNIWADQPLEAITKPHIKTFGFGNGCHWGAEDGDEPFDTVTQKVNELLFDELLHFYAEKNSLKC